MRHQKEGSHASSHQATKPPTHQPTKPSFKNVLEYPLHTRCLKVRHFYVCASSASNETQVRHQKEGSHIPHPFLLWSLMHLTAPQAQGLGSVTAAGRRRGALAQERHKSI